jgi:hypothetical protein
MYVIIDKIILYYIWIIYIIKNYYFKLFKEGGSCKTQIISQGCRGHKSLGTAAIEYRFFSTSLVILGTYFDILCTMF